MKIRGLLLGSTALAFAAPLSAQLAYAADSAPAPEPEPTEFVRACDAFGKGYFYIPGTDTCLRISGFVRSEVQGGDQVYARKAAERHRNTYAWLSRATLRFSTASETDWGTMRTFMELRSDWKAGAEFGSANDNTGGSLRFAYMELGGLRVGLDETIFAHWTGYYGNVMNDDVLDPSNTRTNVISYTFNSGNGFSAILGVEQGNNFNGDGNTTSTSLDNNNIKNGVMGGYRHDSDGTWRFRKLSQQTHNYAPYVVGGLKYEQGWGGVSTVFGYDSYYSSWAAKLRMDANLTDRFSVFLMGGYKSMDDYYNIDDTYGDGGRKKVNRRDGTSYTKLGLYRQVNSMYGDWGGDWALWTGATYKVSRQTSLNFQAAYSDDRTFATAANVSHELLPGLNITPEVAYISWNNKYGQGYKTTDGTANTTVSLKGKEALQGMLRLQRSF